MKASPRRPLPALWWQCSDYCGCRHGLRYDPLLGVQGDLAGRLDQGFAPIEGAVFVHPEIVEAVHTDRVDTAVQWSFLERRWLPLVGIIVHMER